MSRKFKVDAPVCHVCDKSVGFAERLQRGGNVYHYACFRCDQCSKQLQRHEQVQKVGNSSVCNACFAKLCAANGVKYWGGRLSRFHQTLFASSPRRAVQIVQGSSRLARRLKDMPGRTKSLSLGKSLSLSRSSSKKSVEAASSKRTYPRPTDRLVKVFEGGTVRELTEFLEKGRVNATSWLVPDVRALLAEVKSGRTTIGYDELGKAIRVLTTTAISIYSPCDETVLFEVFESPVVEAFEELDDELELENPFHTTLHSTVQKMIKIEAGDTQGLDEEEEEELDLDFEFEPEDEVSDDRVEAVTPWEECIYPSVLQLLDLYFNEEEQVVEARIGNPHSSLLVQPFSLAEYGPREFAARIMLETFNFKDASADFFDEYIFSTENEEVYEPHKELRTLRLVYTCYLKPEIVTRLKKVIPAKGLSSTSFTRGEMYNWWAWVSRIPGNTESVANELSLAFDKNAVLNRIGLVNLLDLEEMAAGAVEELRNVENFIAQCL